MSAEPAGHRDFNERLHSLRGAELGRLPNDARVVLHGGAAGSWYVQWFDENYRGTVDRHICVELFAERPADVTSNVEWLVSSLGDLSPVPDGSVDLVFAGQVVEHLWPQDIAGFLLEGKRVLRPRGHLVLDSPNRRVTEALVWQQPEHTVELTVDEAVELVELAGFEVAGIRGLVLCYDSKRHRFLALDAESMSWDEREGLAAERPEDSFIWWLEARNGNRPARPDLLRQRAHLLTEQFRARRLRDLTTSLEVHRTEGGQPFVAAPPGYAGPLVHGPYFPVDAGAWRATFVAAADTTAAPPDTPVLRLDATSDVGRVTHADRVVRLAELAGDDWTSIDLPVELQAMTMGIELRAFSTGALPVRVQLGVDLRRQVDAPVLPTPQHVGEPRTVELLDMLQRRTRTRLTRLARRT